eukprot:751789-Prymnesium_polylepis.1
MRVWFYYFPCGFTTAIVAAIALAIIVLCEPHILPHPSRGRPAPPARQGAESAVHTGRWTRSRAA